jgi:hypothetical protein
VILWQTFNLNMLFFDLFVALIGKMMACSCVILAYKKRSLIVIDQRYDSIVVLSVIFLKVLQPCIQYHKLYC